MTAQPADASTTPGRIGMIGVGEIARCLVEGWCERVPDAPTVHLSPRGAATAAELSARYPTVQVCADNQQVVDAAEVVVLAVRPQDREEALAGLTIPAEKVVVSALAGVGVDELRRTLATEAPLVRSIPLPAVRHRSAVTAVTPGHPAAVALFEPLGGCVELADEATLNVFSALTATLTTHYWYCATLTEWAAGQGVAAEDADRYVRSLFENVARALGDTSRTLPQLATAHETPNGINERLRTTWFDAENIRELRTALDSLLADLG